MHPFSILTLGIFVAGYITARWDLVTRLYELAIFAAEYGVVVSLDAPPETLLRQLTLFLPLLDTRCQGRRRLDCSVPHATRPDSGARGEGNASGIHTRATEPATVHGADEDVAASADPRDGCLCARTAEATRFFLSTSIANIKTPSVMVEHDGLMRVFWPTDACKSDRPGVVVGWRNSTLDVFVVAVLDDVHVSRRAP